MAWHIEDIDHHKTGVGWHFCLVLWYFLEEGERCRVHLAGLGGYLPTQPASVWRHGARETRDTYGLHNSNLYCLADRSLV